MNNEDKTISEKVLERIEHATPHSRQYFMFRNAGVWALAAASVIVGALAVASIIFRAVNAGAALRPGIPPFRMLVLVVPFLWVALMTVFGYVAYREVRLTRKGYTYEFSTIMLGTLLASVVLGIIFYTSGAGFALDRMAARHLPFQADLGQVQQERWFQPEQGFLMGIITEDEQERVQLVDPNRARWHVQFADTVSAKKVEALETGERVGLRGRTLDPEERVFLACDIRSLEFGGRGALFMRKAGDKMRPLDERKLPPLRSTECEE
ncbi:MAG: hypothetical protein WC030_01970 [Candidatus Paceibacterota bacterium]